jgi:glycosyltransferase involved in cell wall biosynthesis
LRDANIVIASTELEGYICTQMGVDRHNIRMIPNAVDLEGYKNLPERGVFRQKYGLGERRQIGFLLGRIHKAKGIDLLLHTFASISKELESAQLIIAGPDDRFLPSLQSFVDLCQLLH